jgi:hypothetical protein
MAIMKLADLSGKVNGNNRVVTEKKTMTGRKGGEEDWNKLRKIERDTKAKGKKKSIGKRNEEERGRVKERKKGGKRKGKRRMKDIKGRKGEKSMKYRK